MVVADLATDVPLVRRLLRAQFPEWAELPVEPVRSCGTDNAIFRLGRELVVRLPRGRGVAMKVHKEQQWLPGLAPLLPLEVPIPVGWGTPTEEYRWPWSVFRWLEGEDATVARIADPRTLATDLGRFVAALQRVDGSEGPPPGEHNDLRGAPLADHDRLTREAIAALDGHLDGALATAAWEVALRVPPWRGPPKWFQGDLHAANLLVRDGRLSAVIDFGCSGVGDPAYDMMAAWTLCSTETRPLFRAALEVDEATWARGLGCTLAWGVLAFQHLRESHPVIAGFARRALGELLAEHRRTT